MQRPQLTAEPLRRLGERLIHEPLAVLVADLGRVGLRRDATDHAEHVLIGESELHPGAALFHVNSATIKVPAISGPMQEMNRGALKQKATAVAHMRVGNSSGSTRGQRLMRRRGEYVERSFAHVYDTGGLRRTHLRGHQNILKRLLVHAGAFNLGLLMRKAFGRGTPRGLHEAGGPHHLEDGEGVDAHGGGRARGRRLVAPGLRMMQRSATICNVMTRKLLRSRAASIYRSKFTVALGIEAPGFCVIK